MNAQGEIFKHCDSFYLFPPHQGIEKDISIKIMLCMNYTLPMGNRGNYSFYTL